MELSHSILLFGSIYLFSNSQKEMNKILFEYSAKIEENRKELFFPLVKFNATIFVFSGVLMISTMFRTMTLMLSRN